MDLTSAENEIKNLSLAHLLQACVDSSDLLMRIAKIFFERQKIYEDFFSGEYAKLSYEDQTSILHSLKNEVGVFKMKEFSDLLTKLEMAESQMRMEILQACSVQIQKLLKTFIGKIDSLTGHLKNER